jgi:hypothetical protein
VGYEEEKIRLYIRQQEQLAGKGYDEPDDEQVAAGGPLID